MPLILPRREQKHMEIIQFSVQFSFKLHAELFLTQHVAPKRILPEALDTLETALLGFKYHIIQ